MVTQGFARLGARGLRMVKWVLEEQPVDDLR